RQRARADPAGRRGRLGAREAAPGPRRARAGRARAGEEIEHLVARLREGLDDAMEQPLRLLAAAERDAALAGDAGRGDVVGGPEVVEIGDADQALVLDDRDVPEPEHDVLVEVPADAGAAVLAALLEVFAA